MAVEQKEEKVKTMEIYKYGQAKISRLVLIGAGLLWCLYGAIQFRGYVLLTFWPETFGRSLGLGFKLADLGAVFFFLASVAGILVLANYRKLVDFMVETEAEIKKISWTSKNDLIWSTVIVLIFILFFTLYLYTVDLGILFLLRKMLV